MTPKRVIANRPSSSVSVWPSARKSSSSSARRVGSARALNTASMAAMIGDQWVTYQEVPAGWSARWAESACPSVEVETFVRTGRVPAIRLTCAQQAC